jgi:proton-translocating NADH-quinone oxidoreductase chain L
MTVAVLLIIAAVLPLVSFGVLAAVGRRMGTPIAGIVGTFFVGASFLCSLAAMIVWLSLDVADGRAYGFGGQPVLLRWDWIPVGTWLANGGYLQLGIYIDSLTIVMFSMITLVAALVHVFSLGYMAGDARFPRFFTYLGLFCFSMLALVLGGTLLQLLVFWELVGLCSYLLIGFWYEKRTASNAAIKAFLVNRVGDVGFIAGLGLLVVYLGNVTIPDAWGALGNASAVQRGQVLILPGEKAADGRDLSGTVQPATPENTAHHHIPAAMLTLMGIGLFFGAVGKSAQFPLHVWLPDAMEGPTPVSALIHAATMVAAGVYLVARIFPLLTPDAKLYIAITGCATMTIAALIAVAQTDIKRVLAYSTLSQLGLMLLAMGVGSWVGGLFHLITHAFFKALLFLGAGSVIYAARHEQEMTEFGGLLRRLPYTAITFGIAVLSIAGVGITVGDTMIGFSGYYSKELILLHAGAFASLAQMTGRHAGYLLLAWLPICSAGLTAFYMTRCWMLTFFGRPRDPRLYARARERPVMFIPLIVLGVLSVIGGSLMGVRPMLENAVAEANNYFDARLRPAAAADGSGHFAGFATAWRGGAAYPSGEEAEPGPAGTAIEAYQRGHGMLGYATWSLLAGLVLGVLVYSRGLAIPNALLRFPPLRWVRTWLYRAMYFDELYAALIVAPVRLLVAIVGWIDRYVIDGVVNALAWLGRKLAAAAGLNDRFVFDGAVDGVAGVAREIGVAVRAPQTGRIRLYVTVLIGAVALGLAGAIVAVVLAARLHS